MYAGFTAKGAVYAALLAQRGITGIESLFEGKAGIVNVYFGSEYDRAKILEGLGREFMGSTTLYKAWPAVGNAHTYLHATIELMKEHRLDVGEIDQIRVYVGDFGMQMSMPLKQRRAPATLVDAKFSLPYCVAVVVARGQLKVSDFTPSSLKDPFVLSIAQKVIPIEDSNYNWTMKLPNARVEIVARDGRRMERIGDNLPGSLEAPLTWEDLVAKFRDCASLGAVPLTPEKIERAQGMVRSLDTVEDVSELLQLLN
jgi:2-methylcitrate dehydratase PrpD